MSLVAALNVVLGLVFGCPANNGGSTERRPPPQEVAPSVEAVASPLAGWGSMSRPPPMPSTVESREGLKEEEWLKPTF